MTIADILGVVAPIDIQAYRLPLPEEWYVDTIHTTPATLPDPHDFNKRVNNWAYYQVDADHVTVLRPSYIPVGWRFLAPLDLTDEPQAVTLSILPVPGIQNPDPPAR